MQVNVWELEQVYALKSNKFTLTAVHVIRSYPTGSTQ